MNLSLAETFLTFSRRNKIPEFLLRQTRDKLHLHQIKLCRTPYHIIPVLAQGKHSSLQNTDKYLLKQGTIVKRTNGRTSLKKNVFPRDA